MSAESTALVVGGSDGIGHAIAAAFDRLGWRTYALARTSRRLAEAPGAIRFISADLTQPAGLQVAIDRIDAETGRLDALVCAAGTVLSGPYTGQSDDEFERLFRINVLGPMAMIRCALPLLKASRGAVLVIGSTLADHPRPLTAAYAASKGALDSLTKALAVEWGPHGVRINCLRPSMVRTGLMLSAGMSEAGYQSLLAARAQAYPLRRVGEVGDLVEMALLLLSNRSSWTTGAVIDVDGGHSAAGS